MVSKNYIILFFFMALGCSGIVEGLKLKSEAGTQRYCVSVFTESKTIKAYDLPVGIDNEKQKCSIKYYFKENDDFSNFVYHHSSLSIDKPPKNIVYVGDNKMQWCADGLLTRGRHELNCVCEGSLCNGFGSPIHYLLLKIVKNITGVDFPYEFPGFVPTKPVTPKYCYAVFPIGDGVFPISTPYQQVTADEKAGCSIQYTFYVNGTVVKYVHGISQANRPADSKSIIYVGDDNNEWCSYELSYNKFNIYEHKIFCVCDGSLCNGMGSTIHNQLLKKVKSITGSESLEFPVLVPTTNSTAETTPTGFKVIMMIAMALLFSQ